MKSYKDKLFEVLKNDNKPIQTIIISELKNESISTYLIKNQCYSLFGGNCTVKELKSKQSKVKHESRLFAAFINVDLGVAYKPSES